MGNYCRRVAWLLSIGGAISVDAFGYAISTSLGIFIVAGLALLYLCSLVLRVIRVIIFTPKAITNTLEKRAHKNGMQSLTYGLSAVAAGDIKAASYYTKRATKLLKDDYGLVSLLSGLTARLKGDEKVAETSFKSLLKRDETSFLGIRGLLQTALDRGDDRYARVLARQAFETNPKQAWIIKTLYDLEVKHKDYEAAYPLLQKGVSAGVFSKDEARTHEAAMDLIDDNAAQAFKTAPHFTPACLAVLKTWKTEGKRRKSLNLIKKKWAMSPHPDLISAWISWAPKKAQDNAQRMMAWVEDLQRLNQGSASSNLYVAEVALRYDLNAQAKRFLQLAIEIKPTMRAYQLMAQLDSRSGWQDLISKGSHDAAWVCTITGRIYETWRGLTEAGHFNTVEWMYPDDRKIDYSTRASGQSFFLTDSKAA
ncbi:MAG: hypothetical protein COB76_02690 [Alphaproteobacteria bacterium]|nr:MAG: hypothetical protein COB76_02690 [Alphaproteobacteria bacterium]